MGARWVLFSVIAFDQQFAILINSDCVGEVAFRELIEAGLLASETNQDFRWVSWRTVEWTLTVGVVLD